MINVVFSFESQQWHSITNTAMTWQVCGTWVAGMAGLFVDYIPFGTYLKWIEHFSKSHFNQSDWQCLSQQIWIRIHYIGLYVRDTTLHCFDFGFGTQIAHQCALNGTREDYSAEFVTKNVWMLALPATVSIALISLTRQMRNIINTRISHC